MEWYNHQSKYCKQSKLAINDAMHALHRKFLRSGLVEKTIHAQPIGCYLKHLINCFFLLEHGRSNILQVRHFPFNVRLELEHLQKRNNKIFPFQCVSNLTLHHTACDTYSRSELMLWLNFQQFGHNLFKPFLHFLQSIRYVNIKHTQPDHDFRNHIQVKDVHYIE